MAFRPYIKKADGSLVDLPLQAEVAVKVGTTTVGSASKPVYINNGKPTACTESIPTATEIQNLKNQISSLQTQINNMLNGTTVFSLLKANNIDIV